MKPKALAAILIVAASGGWHVHAGVAAPAEGDFYVSPDGRDDAAGTAERPFATLARARDAVRATIAAGLEKDLTVLVRGGIYFLTWAKPPNQKDLETRAHGAQKSRRKTLNSPLVFGPRDSGTEQHAITYAAWGEGLPILSGGRPITGWEQGTDKRWTVTLPEVKAGRRHFRQLFVGGRRAVRARTPNQSAQEYCWRLLDAEITKDLKRHTLTLGPGKLQPWSHLDEVEAVVLKNWATLHKRVERVEPATGLAVLKGPHVSYFSGNRPRKGGGCFFENAPEMLDEPGEWYLDRQTGLLTYRPLEGEDLGQVEVIAPMLGHVLEIAGTEEHPVRNLHFRGLAVMHNHVPLPPEGHHGRQAAFRYGAEGAAGTLPCIARFTHAQDCSFVGGRVAHSGGSGLGLQEGCRRNRLEGNVVFDLAGNGINVGGPNDETLVPRENRIANNYVHHCGAVYYGACGIWAGFAQKTAIEHNLVCEHPYTGISIGWKWDASPTVAREYLVRFNHVHDVMRQVCDGGAIYSLGYQPGTILYRNHLHDVHRSRYAIAAPNNGIFLDQGSKGFLIEENVIYRTAGRPVRHNQNQPEWHTWKENVLADGDLPAGSGGALKRVAEAGLEPAWRKKLVD